MDTRARAIDKFVKSDSFFFSRETKRHATESYAWKMKIFKISILSCTDNRVYTRWIIKRAAIHRELLKGRWARLGLRTTRRSKGNESMGTRGRSNERGGSRSYPRWKLGRPSGERRWGDRLVDRQETISRYRSIDIGRFLSLSLSVFCVVVSSTRFFIFVKRGSEIVLILILVR